MAEVLRPSVPRCVQGLWFTKDFGTLILIDPYSTEKCGNFRPHFGRSNISYAKNDATRWMHDSFALWLSSWTKQRVEAKKRQISSNCQTRIPRHMTSLLETPNFLKRRIGSSVAGIQASMLMWAAAPAESMLSAVALVVPNSSGRTASLIENPCLILLRCFHRSIRFMPLGIG